MTRQSYRNVGGPWKSPKGTSVHPTYFGRHIEAPRRCRSETDALQLEPAHRGPDRSNRVLTKKADESISTDPLHHPRFGLRLARNLAEPLDRRAA